MVLGGTIFDSSYAEVSVEDTLAQNTNSIQVYLGFFSEGRYAGTAVCQETAS